MAIFDYKTGDLLRFLTQTCPPTEVAAANFIIIFIECGNFIVRSGPGKPNQRKASS